MKKRYRDREFQEKEWDGGVRLISDGLAIRVVKKGEGVLIIEAPTEALVEKVLADFSSYKETTDGYIEE